MPSTLDRPLSVAALLNLAALVVALAAIAFDPRLILGINPWIKPAKFFVSVAIYLGTLAWLVTRIEGHRRAIGAIKWTAILTMAGENVLIALQSYRGTTSHFNIATAFDAAVFNAMGILIVLNTLAIIWLLVLFVRAPAPLPPAVLSGIRLGLLLFLIGGAEGAMMVGAESHAVGVPDGGPGLPFVNWSIEGGDLRAAHFVGLHALQVLPLLGWFLSRRNRNAGVATVRIVAVVWGVFFAGLTWLAMSGQPVIRL
jgi:hypothetical protein